MKGRIALALLLLFIFSTYAHAQARKSFYADEVTPRSHNIDYQRLVLELDIDTLEERVSGVATYAFLPMRDIVDTLILDAPGITIKEVIVNGKQAMNTVDDQELKIILPETIRFSTGQSTMVIRYEATPKRGMYFIGWQDSTRRSRRQIWTQGQGIDNRQWVPLFDDPVDKLITEIILTFNSNYQVLSNGKLIKSKVNKKEGTTTWHYAMQHPHSPYLMMVGVGKYGIAEEKSASGVPLLNYYYPEHPDWVEPTYRYTAEIMNYFENLTGVKFPWEKYAQLPVQDFIYGAMENTTATIFGDFFHVDRRGFIDNDYVGVNAHEMAHQWFGDFISAKSSSHLWLQESFATHYAKLAERHLYGVDVYDWERYREAQKALAASDKEKKPVAHSQAGTDRIYPKGSFIIGMLKEVITPEEYNRVVTHYLKEHKYGHVTTYDFQDAFHDVLGLNLEWFFDQWIRQGGEPHYQVSYYKSTVEGQSVTEVYIKQIQETTELSGYYRMPISTAVYYKDGTKSVNRVTVEGPSTRVSIPNPQNKEIAFVLFDPNYKILKRLTFRRSEQELMAQVELAEHWLDVYQALVELRDVPFERKRKVLAKAYNEAKYYPVQVEVLQQLSTGEGQDVKVIYLNAKGAKEREVRATAVQHMPAGLLEYDSWKPLLRDSSYSVILASAERLLELYPQNAELILYEFKELEGLNKKVEIKHLGWVISQFNLYDDMQGKVLFQKLADYAGPSYEFRTRINAMQEIQRLNYLTPTAANAINDAASSKNWRLAAPAREVRQHFKDQYKWQGMFR